MGEGNGKGYVYDDDPPTPNYPKGCYKSGPVWFNDHATGSKDKYSQPICIKSTNAVYFRYLYILSIKFGLDIGKKLRCFLNFYVEGSCETWKETCEPDLTSHWCTRTEEGYGKNHTMCKYPDCHQPSCGCVHKKFTGITDQVNCIA